MKKRSLLQPIVLFAVSCLLCGCAKFKSHRRLDLGPFAEQTIASVSTLNTNLSQRRRVLTLEYVKPLTALDAEAAKHIETLEVILEQMIDYSILVARLTKTESTEAERIELFARYLEGLRSSIERDTDLSLSTEARADIIADVRAQEKLLDAMGAAQPLINRTAQVAAVTVRELRHLADEYEDAVGQAIEADFEEALAFRRKSGEERDLLLSALSRVYDYRGGDAGALEALLSGPGPTSAWPAASWIPRRGST